MWKLIAYICSRPRVAEYLIRKSMNRPYRHITSADGKDVYMGRWWLFNPYEVDYESGKKSLFRFPISIRIHHICRADHDRDLHDHPWNARTIIIKGGYVEERLGPVTICRDSGATASLRFGEYHRITHVQPGGAWTIFITGKYRGTWGFLVDGAKVQWRKYLGLEQ
jgi:hypothetical protein